MSELFPDEQADWEALARYLAGESPPEEADAVRARLAEDPARAELLGALDTSLDRLAFRAPADLDVEGALGRVKERLDEPVVLPFPARRVPTPWWRAAGLRAAAAVLIVVGGALLFWKLLGSGGTPAAGPRSYATATGERDSLRLPDGTGVLLGPGSRLVVAAGYGAPDREVELQGEALFEVRHDAARPFAVRAGAAVVRDIGTRFTVRSDTGRVRVVVTDGSVRLGPTAAPEGRGVVLRPGDRGVLAAGRDAVAQRAAATDDDLAWTRGRLVFQDAPLAQVRADLRRWYGIELRSDPALDGRHLTASFEGDPAQRVVRVVALALGARLEMRGDTAVLHAGSAGSR